MKRKTLRHYVIGSTHPERQMTTSTEHRDNEGACLVTLGPLPVLASYTVDEFGDVEVVAVSINGHEIGAECFHGEQCTEWAKDIAKDRADDERMHREAAADDLAMALEVA
jgi:hypothetical protein